MDDLQLLLIYLSVAFAVFLFFTQTGNQVLGFILRALFLANKLLESADFWLQNQVRSLRLKFGLKKLFDGLRKAGRQSKSKYPQLAKYRDSLGSWNLDKLREDKRMHWHSWFHLGFPNYRRWEEFVLEASFEDGYAPTDKDIREKKKQARKDWERLQQNKAKAKTQN